MSAKKYYTRDEMLIGQREAQQRRRLRDAESYIKHAGPVRPVTEPWKPIRQVFLRTTLPVLGSYNFGAVVRRSL